MTLYVDECTKRLESEVIEILNSVNVLELGQENTTDILAAITDRRFFLSTPQGAIMYKTIIEEWLMEFNREQFWNFVEKGPEVVK